MTWSGSYGSGEMTAEDLLFQQQQQQQQLLVQLEHQAGGTGSAGAGVRQR